MDVKAEISKGDFYEQLTSVHEMLADMVFSHKQMTDSEHYKRAMEQINTVQEPFTTSKLQILYLCTRQFDRLNCIWENTTELHLIQATC